MTGSQRQELAAHAPRALWDLLKVCAVAFFLLGAVDFVLTAIADRAVMGDSKATEVVRGGVDHPAIPAAWREDQAVVCAYGIIDKRRACGFPSDDAKDWVSFWQEVDGVQLEQDYAWRDKFTERPDGKTGFGPWCFVTKSDVPIIGQASHLCGTRKVGPREFIEIMPPDRVASD